MLGLITWVSGPRPQIARSQSTELAPHPLVAVMAASHPLVARSLVTDSDVKAISIRNPQPSAAYSKEDVVGHVIDKNLGTGDIIFRDDLRDASTLGMAGRVQPGQRAFSIRVMEDEIVGGFLQSGDRVDIFATIPGSAFPTKDSGAAPDRSQTIQLLQDVLVLAVGESSSARSSIQSGARTVSLSLAPDALARLALAQRFGKVSLAIRKAGDHTQTPPASAVLTDLVRTPSQAARATRGHPVGIPYLAGARTTTLSPQGGAP